MFEKLKAFLNGQKGKEAEKLPELWHEKRKFVETVLLECIEKLYAAMDTGKVAYKERLERYAGRFQIKNIKGFPLATTGDSSEGLLFNPSDNGHLPSVCYVTKHKHKLFWN